MAKGRKPNTPETVVPMREDAASGHNLEARAHQRLAELTPRDLEEGETLWTFRRLALPLCHPTRDRLDEGNVFMFLQLVRAVVRHEKLMVAIEASGGETYEVQTRHGRQIKTRPEVGQLNETFRQIRGLAGEFGMTPATRRAAAGGAQLPFDFPPAGEEGFLT